MDQHGPQCICEICTCGRHQCPFNRSKSNTEFQLVGDGNGTNAEGHFYRKEFATVTDGVERARATRPKGELTLGQRPISTEIRRDDLHPAFANNNNDARNERFVTSAALRKRTQNSQIELGAGSGRQTMRSTYREESERALQENGADQRNRPSRPTATSTQLFNDHPETPKTTIHRTEFGIKQSEKAQLSRPKTSDLWKKEGAMEEKTTSREQFAEKRPERSEPFRPKENAPILGNGDRAFQRETSNLSEFGPKRGERVEGRRPPNSELFRRGEPLLERTTVNGSEYGREGRGERFERRVPKEEGGELLRGDGTFLSETSKNAEFQPKRGDRFEAKVQGSSDIWKRDGGEMEQMSVTRSEYKGGQGERFEASKPLDSDILRAHGSRFQAESVARSEFGEKGKGERFAARRPGTDEIWRREGRMGEGGTANRMEYTIEEEGGGGEEERRMRRVGRRRQEATPLFDPDIEPSQPLSTVHRTEFVQRNGERAARRMPKEEGGELLRGDGTFLSETSKSAEFQPKRGDRFEAKVQGSSDIWKTEGKMENQTVNREEYRQKRGERVEQKRPQQSDMAKGEGRFATETHKQIEFGPKKGERARAIKPTDSKLFTREGQVGMESSINRTDYSHTRGERAERRVQPDSGILVPAEGAEFARSTVQRDDYNEKIRERVEQHRPSQQWHLDDSQAGGYGTVTSEDFVEKRLEKGDLDESPVVRRKANESSFGLGSGELVGDDAEFGRTLTQEEFAPKDLGERTRPVVHRPELTITDPEAAFHSSTMYSDNFQQISPNSYGSRSQIRPSTALKLDGERELVSGYQSEYTNKIMPCPAGELINSLENHACQDAAKGHPHTDNFEFHSINKGHHLYRSKENLTEV